MIYSHTYYSCSRLGGNVNNIPGCRASRQGTASVNSQQRSWQHVSTQQQDRQTQYRSQPLQSQQHQQQQQQQEQQQQTYNRRPPLVRGDKYARSTNLLSRPSAHERAEFDSLWAGFKKELQLSKEAASAITQRVYQGLLPCDAPFLRARALQLIALDASFPDMRFRTLLSSHSATLAHPPELLGERARRLQRLLPSQDTTTVMATVMEHMSASADILALWLCELELPFQEVFKMSVPPAVFSHCYSQAAAAAALEGGQGRRAGSTAAAEVFPTCDVLQILERCEVLRDLVGPESGYAMLRRHAGLLDIAPDVMRGRVASLQTGLSLHENVELCRVLEGAPALLVLPEGVAVFRAERLQEVLGWSEVGVRTLVVARSQVLLVETELAERKLLLLREAATAGGAAGRGAWCLELLGGQCDADAMARVLLSGWEVLGRVQYLAQRPGERGGMRATDVLAESRQAFARAVPRYSRWWVENGRQLVDELGFEEEEFTRNGGGWIEEEGDPRTEGVESSPESIESPVMEEKAYSTSRADGQSSGGAGRLTSSQRPRQHNQSHSVRQDTAPWQGLGRR